jgi:hypothetical protein
MLTEWAVLPCLVSNTGGCHTRSMMCDNEFDWKKLKEYDVSRREMIVAQQKLYEHKAKIISCYE